jgi:pimeloyl-ACP methyl ester carboxylesterase
MMSEFVENELIGYERHGTGWPVILIHGYLGGALVWKDFQKRFGSEFDLIAPDLAGFGSSAELSSPKTISGHAKQVLALIDQLEIKQFHVIGHSMGGMVAQEIALAARERVARLVLYGTSSGGPTTGRFESVEATRKRLQHDGVYETARYIAATWFANGEKAPAYPACLKIAGTASMDGAISATHAFGSWNGRDRLSHIKAPTLVIWGDRDRSISLEECTPLWREIADSSLAVCPRCAHNVHFDNSELFNKHIEDFFIKV